MPTPKPLRALLLTSVKRSLDLQLITPQQAMERFHASASDGRILSGAATLVDVWSRLPNGRWVARLAELLGVLAALELVYRRFFRFRSSCPVFWKDTEA